MHTVPLSYKYDSLIRSLESVCGVREDVSRNHDGRGDVSVRYYNAQWDTGAMATVISERVANELHLEPTLLVPNYTANGLVNSFLFRIDLLLPNNVLIPSIEAACCNLGDSGIDILIGMDVITMCDFAITNVEEKTTFSFQIPSATTIDFEKSMK